MKRTDYLGLAGRLWVGLVFAYAGWSKLMEPWENFQAAILDYGVIPYGWSPVIAMTLPWLEFFFGVFLFIGYAPRLSAAVLGLLALGFIGLLSVMFVRNGAWPAECGCFGKNGIRLTGLQLFTLDTANFLICLKLFFQPASLLSLDRFLHR